MNICHRSGSPRIKIRVESQIEDLCGHRSFSTLCHELCLQEKKSSESADIPNEIVHRQARTPMGLPRRL